MRVRTCSGCFATSASAFTAPPLEAKRSIGPAPSAEMMRLRSSACSSGVVSDAPSVRLLRSTPRGSYVTTVRSLKCLARVPKPAAPIGDRADEVETHGVTGACRGCLADEHAAGRGLRGDPRRDVDRSAVVVAVRLDHRTSVDAHTRAREPRGADPLDQLETGGDRVACL